MDPLSALSVACAVVQFVDAGCTIVKKCKEVYVSAGGSTERNAELSAYAERLETHLSSLNGPTSGTGPHGILVLQQKCLVTAGKLQDAIRKTNIVLPAKGRQRFVRALFGTARSLWWEKDIAEIEKKLHGYRIELDEHILKEVYENVQKRLPDIQRMLSSLATDQRRMAEALLSGQKSVEGMMGSIDRLTDQVQNLQSSLQQREEERLDRIKAEEMRASLQFPNMSQRQTRIRKQGEGTFTWLLEPPEQSHPGQADRPTLEHPFVYWLTHDHHNLYWIWGKAGSGKSTLMKMLCMTEKSKVTDLLQDWSAKQPVLLPAYFFWRSGDSDQQKSIQGLLQTLLLRIVEGAHELTSDLVDPSDETWAVTSDGWTVEQLESALHRILARRDRPHICFFIDGLDEIEERPDELIDTIKTLCRYDRVKVCVSSRPEFEFLEYVGTPGKLPHLRLEVINAVDIATFTESKLHSIASQRDDLSDLAQEIKSSAQGVFIWVDYVIQYMTTPIKQGESMTDLMARLEHTPKKVEELYEAMFKDMGSFELREAAILFRLALLPDADINIATCIIILHQEKLQSPAYEFSMEFIDRHLEQFGQRLRSRSHGLLEPATQGPAADMDEAVGIGQMLQFTHRTAAAFATKALDSGVFPPISLQSVYGQLCQATARLLYADSIRRSTVTPEIRSSLRRPFIKYDPDVTEVFEVQKPHLYAFLSWCRLAYPDNESLVLRELECLARRIEFKEKNMLELEKMFPSNTFIWAALLGTSEQSEHLCIFDTLCVTEDLIGPVSLRLDRLDLDERRKAYTYLLAVAVLLLREKWGKPYKQSHSTSSRILEVIRTLVRSGADVNELLIYEIDGLYTDYLASSWQFFLTTLVDVQFLRLSPLSGDGLGFRHRFHSDLKTTTIAFLLAGADVMDNISVRYILEEWNYERRESGTWAVYVGMSATLSLYVLFALLGHDDAFWNDLSKYMPADEPRPAIVSSVERHHSPAQAMRAGRTPLWQWHRRRTDRDHEVDEAVVSLLNAKPTLQKRSKPRTVTWVGGTQAYVEIDELMSLTNLLRRMQAEDWSGGQAEGKTRHEVEEESDPEMGSCGGFPASSIEDDGSDISEI